MLRGVAKPKTKYYLHSLLNDRSIFSSRPNYFILYYKICKALNTQSRNILSLNTTSVATSENSNGRQTNVQKIKHYRNMRTFIQSASIVVSFAVTSLPADISWLMFVCGATVQTEVITWTNIVSVFGVNAVNAYIYGVSDKALR